jgi:hypothetical protein
MSRRKPPEATDQKNPERAGKDVARAFPVTALAADSEKTLARCGPGLAKECRRQSRTLKGEQAEAEILAWIGRGADDKDWR